MLPAEQAHGEALIALARTRFDPELREIEQQVLRHSCAYEDPADWIADPDQPDPTRHETTGRPLAGWQGPEIRPTLIRWLLTDPEATALLEPRGLRIWNARLADPLDLIGCTIPARLELRYCLVEAPIQLDSAEIPSLSIRRSLLQHGLSGNHIRILGLLLLEDVVASSLISLDAATVEGQVRIRRTRLDCESEALSMQNAVVSKDLWIWPYFECKGSVLLRRICVGGLISLSGARLTGVNAILDLEGASVSGGVFLTQPFTNYGPIRMHGSRILGQFNCQGAKMLGDGITLNLDLTSIGGSVAFNEGFLSKGIIRLVGTKVGGELSLNKARLDVTGLALNLESADIHSHVLLNDFECPGELRFSFAKIGGQLVCADAVIGMFRGENMSVGADFMWTGIKNAKQVVLNLVDAQIKTLRDDRESWPDKEHLFVNDLSLKEIYLHKPPSIETRFQRKMGSPLPLRALDRISWLNRQALLNLAEPQPWLHLASHFEAKGHKRAAKRVIYELRKHQSRANWKNSRFKHLGYFWDTRFARLEQQPFFILIPILLLTALSGTTFHAYRAHFAETGESAYKATHTPNPQAAASYPRFQPYVYALENVLPVIKLGQDDKWAPDPAHTDSGLYRTLVWLRWFLILSGWVMGGILAAAVSARFRS